MVNFPVKKSACFRGDYSDTARCGCFCWWMVLWSGTSRLSASKITAYTRRFHRSYHRETCYHQSTSERVRIDIFLNSWTSCPHWLYHLSQGQDICSTTLFVPLRHGLQSAASKYSMCSLAAQGLLTSAEPTSPQSAVDFSHKR